MNRRTNARSSSLFLIELIISILFFAVASSVCVQFFVRARLMSRESAQLTEAVSACSTASETIASGDSLADIAAALSAVYPDASVSFDGLTDGSSPVTITLSDTLTAACTLDGQLLTASLSFTPEQADTPAYTLTVKKHLTGGEP